MTRAARAALGTGPTRREGRTINIRTLAPYVALAALVPLLIIIGVRGRVTALPRSVPLVAAFARRAFGARHRQLEQG